MKKNPDEFHILFVADNPEKIYDIKNLLEHSGYFVECRSAYLTGLQYLMINNPDLLIVDNGIEGDRGIEFVTTVCNDPQFSNLPVIMVGKVSKDGKDIIKGFEAGVEDYIAVPFIPGVFKARVHRFKRKKESIEVGKVSLSVEVTAKEIPGILQYLEAEQKTGALKIVSEEHNACIYMLNGRLVNAKADTLSGVDAITEVLCWPQSKVTFEEEQIPESDIQMDLEVTGIVMNCAVQIDEYEEIKRHLPADQSIFKLAKPLPANMPENQRNICAAALSCYSITELITGGIEASERKATIYLKELLDEGYLKSIGTAFDHYTTYCYSHYKKSRVLESKLADVRHYYSQIQFPLEQSSGYPLNSADWLSSAPSFIVCSDNADHINLFFRSMDLLYGSLVERQAPSKKMAGDISIKRYDLGNRTSFDLISLPAFSSQNYALGLEDALENASAIIQLSSAQDIESCRNVTRLQRYIRQRFKGLYYNVVSRVNTNGKYLFKINCVHCGFKLAVDMEEAGFSGECPVCNETISIPNAMDNLSHVLQLPDDVPVVMIEPVEPSHCRDLFLMILDNIIKFQSMTEEELQTDLSELKPKKQTQISVAKTQFFKVDPGLLNENHTPIYEEETNPINQDIPDVNQEVIDELADEIIEINKINQGVQFDIDSDDDDIDDFIRQLKNQ